MNNRDTLQRFLFENAPVRGQFVHLDDAYQTMMALHEYPPLIRQLLGEASVLVTLLAGIIKFKGRISIQFQGKDKLKLMLVQCNDQFEIRGLVQWLGDEDVQKKDLLEDLQHGVLVITVDPETGGQRYQGMVMWQGNSLAESIEGYFRDSEQLKTRIWIAVDENRAAGMMLQMTPVSEQEKLITNHDHQWEHAVVLADTLKPGELLTLPNEKILHRLYHEDDVRLFDTLPVMFRCTCSRKRGENAILMLGEEEVQAELAQNQVIDVTCDFCNKKFTFDRVDIATIFKQGDPPPSSTQLH